MASSSKLISILFLFAFFSMQIHSRKFFSKIPNVNTNEKETTVVTETQKVSEQEPTFMPETQSGYGLYGHESGQLPPSTTTTAAATTTPATYEPYVTPVRYHPDEPYNSIPAGKANNKKNGYETEQTNLDEAKFTEKRWETNENNNNNYKNGYETKQNNLGSDKFREKRWSPEENNNNNNNGEKLGMSDTRFLENGKYQYDVKNYYPNQFENPKNEFNENRYNNNNMDRYNQSSEEFEENEEEFEP